MNHYLNDPVVNAIDQAWQKKEEYEDLMRYLEQEYEIDSVEQLFDALEEHQRILNFFSSALEVQGRAKDKNLELVFHVFTDEKDSFLATPSTALDRYLQLRTRGEQNVRLYYQLYSDRENDEMEEEDCLISYGGYPR